jgi:hypothetical protein
MKRMLWYKLVDKIAVPCKDAIEAAQAFEDSNRVVKQTYLKPTPYWVSTVFLGLDHNHGEGPPLVFETMVFKGDDFSELAGLRYSTWDEAVLGHWDMVEEWCKRLDLDVNEFLIRAGSS